MAFPTGQTISTANLTSGTSNPSLARADLLQAVTYVNDIIASENSASGVMVLNGSGRIPSSTIPEEITLSSGVQVINPASGVVNIRSVLRLQALTTLQAQALTGTAGDIIYCSDGAGGSPCLAVYDGTSWKRISLGTAISST